MPWPTLNSNLNYHTRELVCSFANIVELPNLVPRFKLPPGKQSQFPDIQIIMQLTAMTQVNDEREL